MKLFIRIAHISLVVSIFIASTLLLEGFSEGTKVHTALGIRPIQEIKVGDAIINLNKKTNKYTQDEVVIVQQKIKQKIEGSWIK